MGSTIVVRGTASDPDGVANVTVNGVSAVLTPLAAAAISSSRAGSSLRAFVPFGTLADTETLSEEEATEVEWSVEIELEHGDNVLVVTMEDATGDVTADADMVETSYHEVPVTFTLDEANHRLVGLSWTLTPTGRVQRLVEHDYETSQQTIYSELDTSAALGCFRAPDNDFYDVMLAADDAWVLRRFNLETRELSSVDIPPAYLDPGEGFKPEPRMRRFVCGDVSHYAYLLANYVPIEGEGEGVGSGGFAKSRILRFTLPFDGVEILTESDPEELPLWLAMDITLVDGGLISLADTQDLRPLTFIPSPIGTPDGTRNPLAPDIDIGGHALAATIDGSIVYVASLDGIDEVIIDEQERRPIEPDEHTDLLFSQIVAMALDLTNDRVIIGDSALDALVAVDLEAGEHSELLSRKVGEGPLFIAPRAFAVTADESLAYMVDDGGNRPERLFEVDLANGNRRVVGDIAQGNNVPVTGLALDEEGRRAFVARQDLIVKVDLDSEETSVIASLGGQLTGISALAYDPANDRLLVGDAGEAIFEINLANNQVGVISGESQGGPPFAGIASIALTGEAPLAYVANQTTNELMTVDLDTGERELVPLACLEEQEPETLHQVLLDADSGELIVLADKLFVVDPQTSECAAVPGIPHRIDPLHVQVTPKGRMLTALFNALGQLDRESGHVVVVSK